MVSFNSLVLFFLVALALLWRRPQFWIHALMLFLGAFVGLSSVWTNETIVPVFLLLAFSAFGGFAQPAKAWLMTVLLATWVPVATSLAMLAGALPVNPTGILNSCFAFVPAAIGAGIGLLVNRAAGRPVFRMELSA
jgi:hypothetical protein